MSNKQNTDDVVNAIRKWIDGNDNDKLIQSIEDVVSASRPSMDFKIPMILMALSKYMIDTQNKSASVSEDISTSCPNTQSISDKANTEPSMTTPLRQEDAYFKAPEEKRSAPNRITTLEEARYNPATELIWNCKSALGNKSESLYLMILDASRYIDEMVDKRANFIVCSTTVYPLFILGINAFVAYSDSCNKSWLNALYVGRIADGFHVFVDHDSKPEEILIGYRDDNLRNGEQPVLKLDIRYYAKIKIINMVPWVI